jgi:hypothetical protein
MHKTIIEKFPPRNPQQQQYQPRLFLDTAKKKISPIGSHYVILPPEEIPVANSLFISKINQKHDEGICSLSEDGPCSLPTVRMISRFSTCNQPYLCSFRRTRRTTITPARQRSNRLGKRRGISRVFGHGCSAPIGETTPRGDNFSSSFGS